MDIHSLQCFLSLAQYLNYTKTAEKEHLTQPSLSRKIDNSKAELGVRLFNRDSHQVSLTEAGKEFYYDTQKASYYIRGHKGSEYPKWLPYFPENWHRSL